MIGILIDIVDRVGGGGGHIGDGGAFGDRGDCGEGDKDAEGGYGGDGKGGDGEGGDGEGCDGGGPSAEFSKDICLVQEENDARVQEHFAVRHHVEQLKMQMTMIMDLN